MRKCHYCDKEELCGVGADNIPVCEDHYDDYLRGKARGFTSYGKLNP